MIRQSLLFFVLVYLKVAFSLPVEEKITPVELKYYCVEVKDENEKAQDNIPVLLMHGVLGSHKTWDGINLLISLQTKSRVCSVDLRNHGESPWDKRADVKALVADLAHFLDKQGIEKVNLVGHSLGGKVAIDYTLNNPDRVNSIVVEDIRPNGNPKQAYALVTGLFILLNQAIQTVPAQVTEEKAKEIIVDFLIEKLSQMGIEEKITTRTLGVQLKLVDGKWHFKHNMEALLEAMKDPDKSLGEISGLYEGPALFIYGDKSPFKIGEDKDNILKLFPKAELVPVEGAGHVIHGQFPKYDDEVVKFLKKANS